VAERDGQINAAGAFLRSLGAQRAGAQAASDSPASLPIARTLETLSTLAPVGSEGIGIDMLAAELAISRSVLSQTVANLIQLSLIVPVQADRGERIALSELGAMVAEKAGEHDPA
jgi:hypothetical protein